MKREIRALMTVTVLATLPMIAGCGQKAASSSEAIQHAQTLKTPQQQADYLVTQAQSFLNSKQYQEAIQSAQYVLAKIDVNSQAARDLLEKAKTQLAGDAQGAVSDAKKKLGL